MHKYKKSVECYNHNKPAALPSGLTINPLELWRPYCNTRAKYSRHTYKFSNKQALKRDDHFIGEIKRPVSQCYRLNSTMNYYTTKPKRVFVLNPRIQFASILQRRSCTSKTQSRPQSIMHTNIRLNMNRTSQLQFRKNSSYTEFC